MPLYGYLCDNGHEFEKIVPLDEFFMDQLCHCGAGADRTISAPRVLSDRIDPMLGIDGKYHDSIASFKRATSKDGEKLHVIDGPDQTKFVKPKASRQEIRNSIKAGIEDVKNGRVPNIVNSGDF